MKFLIQRVKKKTHIVSQFDGKKEEGTFNGPGLVVLMGWESKDEENALEEKEDWLISRAMGLRVFPDAEGRMNYSLEKHLELLDAQEGGILWVPQFTLAASLKSGFRPSFTQALDPVVAKKRFEICRKKIESHFKNYKNIFGVFSADMDLSFTNWGPVTLILER